jgi:hypothetical protein
MNEIQIAADPDFRSWSESRGAIARSSRMDVGHAGPALLDRARVAGLPDTHVVRAEFWQTRAVLCAVDRARTWGLKFPGFSVRFVNPPEAPGVRLLGVTRLLGDRGALRVVVSLHARLRPEALVAVCLHECFHVAQHILAPHRTPREIEELEADDFAGRVLGIRPEDIGRGAFEELPSWAGKLLVRD